MYILECADGSLYTGYTNDLDKRLRVHNAKQGARCLRGKLPARLVWSREYRYLRWALKEEYRIKQLKRKDKERLVATYRG